jgi:alpha-mannosidase
LTLRKGKAREPGKGGSISNRILENRLIRYRFSKTGRLVEALDRETGRRYMTGKMEGNRLCLFEDRPADWDAWDIDIFYENQLVEEGRLESCSRIASGPVREGIEMVFSLGRSKIVQRIYLAANSRRLDFVTQVSWREDHKLLRVYFEVDVWAENAAYNIQFGHVRRPVHRNTSADMARFESVGHRYADLSEPTHGVALLNDCKYGYQVLDNSISLSLLRAPTMPDPSADRGEHEFTYSLLPHSGGLMESDVLAEAAGTDGILTFNGRDASHFDFPFRIEGDCILESLKKAEDDEGSILRLYEPAGKRCSAALRCIRKPAEIVETDLMEREIRRLPLSGGTVHLDFKRFEIRTIKIVWE